MFQAAGQLDYARIRNNTLEGAAAADAGGADALEKAWATMVQRVM